MWRRLRPIGVAALVGAMGLAGAVSNAVVARAAAPPAPWSVVSSPDQTGTLSEISGISCTTASFCVAVGNYQPGSPRSQVLVEMWNGTSWSVVAAPNPSPTDDFLTGVTCMTTTACIAVGDTESAGWTSAFIEFLERFDMDGDCDPESECRGPVLLELHLVPGDELLRCCRLLFERHRHGADAAALDCRRLGI